MAYPPRRSAGVAAAFTAAALIAPGGVIAAAGVPAAAASPVADPASLVKPTAAQQLTIGPTAQSTSSASALSGTAWDRLTSNGDSRKRAGPASWLTVQAPNKRNGVDGGSGAGRQPDSWSARRGSGRKPANGAGRDHGTKNDRRGG